MGSVSHMQRRVSAGYDEGAAEPEQRTEAARPQRNGKSDKAEFRGVIVASGQPASLHGPAQNRFQCRNIDSQVIEMLQRLLEKSIFCMLSLPK